MLHMALTYRFVVITLLGLFTTTGDAFVPAVGYNMTPYRPVYSWTDPRTSSRNVFNHPLQTLCSEKNFGLYGVKVPVCQRTFRYSFSRPPVVSYKMGHLDRKTTQALLRQYGGFLQPRAMHTASRDGISHDGDLCCPTVRGLQEAPFRKVDSHGHTRHLIHIPEEGMYQYHPSGTCLDSSQQGYCQGTCVQEMTTIFMAVFQFTSDLGFSFEPFDVPAYCSCRNIALDKARGQDKARGPQSRQFNQTTTTAKKQSPHGTEPDRPGK